MLDELKREVCKANILLVKYRLVILSFGNVSGIDRKRGLVVIKPSGVSFQKLTPEKMVIVDLQGKVVEGKLKPSMDTPTHLALYRAWPEIRGICHTHSPYATSFAQAGKAIPCLGTTHADHFYGEIPITRYLSKKEVKIEYEKNTGKVIVEHFSRTRPINMPAVLVARHGPFTWGSDPEDAVANSLVLEEIAKMAFTTILLNPKTAEIQNYLLDQHFLRKHGPRARYGQKTDAALKGGKE